jgi:hypothetical protein
MCHCSLRRTDEYARDISLNSAATADEYLEAAHMKALLDYDWPTRHSEGSSC